MSWKSVDHLRDTLARMRLLDAASLDECMIQLPASKHSPEGLLEALERRGLLTSYQLSLLKKGETNGLVLGEFKLLYRNASGSFARVYRGCSVEDGRMIGLKVLRGRWAKDVASVAQFRREAELCKKLRHKNIVPIYDVGSQGEYHWLTMEFVEGGNLKDILAIRRKFSPVDATRCVLDLAEGLEYALRLGITHRDLKATNVLMTSTGVAKLVDFGLAGLEEGEAGSGTGAGDGQQRALEYATLEKSTGAPPNDPRSDLYFLGGIYYELLTGTPPYPRTNDRQERKQVSRYRNIRPLRQVDPTLPRACTDIVDQLMQFAPELRYQSPTQLAGDLRNCLKEIGDSTRNETRTLPGAAAGLRNDGETDLPLAETTAAPNCTILIVESRPKQQDMMREYFTKRGFRVLLLTDGDRALTRLAGANPPDCVVFVGDSLGEDVVRCYSEAVQRTTTRDGIGVVAILTEKQKRFRDEMPETSRSQVMVQPITLRELRKTISGTVPSKVP
ncbi:MAG: protein kinase [Planctomycetaceae bacterium]|nr:protein kinase [Planctomycetaceae bacterium]